MGINTIFEMVKADRYTQDGRDKIAEVKDKVYNIGEISPKTGLQKTANGWRPVKKGAAPGNSESKPAGSKPVGATGNEEQRKRKNFMENSQKNFEAANSVATTETDKANLKKIKSFMDEEHGTFKNALYNNAESLVRKGSNGAPDRENEKSLLKFAEAAGMGDDLKLYLKEEVNSKYDFGGGDAEKKPAAPKPSVQEYMKAQDTVKKYEETYKKQLEEYENGQRLRANGGGAILDPMYGLKPNDLSKNEEYQKAKDIIQRMEAEDSAPQTYTAQTVNASREKLARTLTGDTKIKVRRK